MSYLDNPLVADRHQLFLHLVRLCGDIQLKLGSKTNIDRYRKEYVTVSGDEETTLKSIACDLPESSKKISPTMYIDVYL